MIYLNSAETAFNTEIYQFLHGGSICEVYEGGNANSQSATNRKQEIIEKMIQTLFQLLLFLCTNLTLIKTIDHSTFILTQITAFLSF